jgi:hypothetical protein
MSGIKALRKIQLGKESTYGVAVPATTIWRGMGVIEDTTSVVFPEEDVGIIPGTSRAYIPVIGGKIEFDDVEATFEQLPYILAAGVDGVTTGAADGAGSGKIYSYSLPTTTVKTPKSFTIEAGDNQRAERMTYALVESFKISGKAKEALKVSASWLGRAPEVSTFTPTVPLPSVEEILFQSGTLYLDAAGGAFGGTPIANTLIGFEIDVKTGLTLRWTADGDKNFAYHQMGAPEITVKLTFEYNGIATAEIDNWRAGVTRLMQLAFYGSNLQTGGTTYQKKTFIANLAGKWEKFEKLDEDDGNDIVSGTFRVRYDPISAKFAEFIVVNELPVLP